MKQEITSLLRRGYATISYLDNIQSICTPVVLTDGHMLAKKALCTNCPTPPQYHR